MKNYILFTSDKISIDKLKEMIYILYKRYLIYFTKNDIERMIDFELKDERLFNLKYVLVYDSNYENQIRELIFDTNRFDPLLDNYIYYDNLSSKFNAYINYFINHYNMKSIPQSIIKLILKTIIEDDGNKNEYQKKNLDTIALVISRDNLQYIHLYKMIFGNNLKIEEGYSYIINLNDKVDMQDIVLSNENNNLEINNSFGENFEISFEEFRNLFFKLPFLSELLRVSCSYIHQINGIEDDIFDELKIEIITDDANNIEISEIFQPKKSNTVKDLIKEIIKKHSNNNTIDFLRNPSLFICEVVNTHTHLNEEILYLDSFYSNLFLKNSKKGIIKITLNKNEISIFNHNIVEKIDGYCKKFIDNETNFEWRKAKINDNTNVHTIISVDHPFKVNCGQNDFVIDFNDDDN